MSATTPAFVESFQANIRPRQHGYGMTETSPSHGPVITWTEEFAHRYDEWSASMTADIDFYIDLARTATGPIVELAVGSGRVAIPVARATGRPVIGIDRSATMLDQARTNARIAVHHDRSRPPHPYHW